MPSPLIENVKRFGSSFDNYSCTTNIMAFVGSLEFVLAERRCILLTDNSQYTQQYAQKLCRI